MQTQTLKVEIPKGYEFDSFDPKKSELVVRPKPKGMVTTIDELLEENGGTRDEFDKNCASLTADEKAYVLLKMLAATLNQGWTPNWKDSNELKYYPWFEMAGSSGFRFSDYDYWVSHSFVGSRLCYKSKELAQHAGKYFADVYEEFMVIKP